MQKIKTLYDRDYSLWLSQTISHLRAGRFGNLDLDNLLEELEALGRSERQQLRNRLNTLLEHLLRRLYVDLPNDFNGWERTIREQRKQLIWLLEDSPSLKSIWDETTPHGNLHLKMFVKTMHSANFPIRGLLAETSMNY